MNVAATMEALRTELASEADPATFLDAVLSATGIALSDDEKDSVIVTHTREQIMMRLATLAEM